MSAPDFSTLYRLLALYGQQHPELHTWLAQLPLQLQQGLSRQRFPEFTAWWKLIEKLPQLASATIDLNSSAITASNAYLATGAPLSSSHKSLIYKLLQDLKPWRKGPYLLHDIYIDTEWRSDFKWQRLLPHISDLRGRKVLDVGGGSGYHAWRCAGAGAEFTLCIDPSPRYFAQFAAVRKLLGFNPLGSNLSVPKLPEVWHLPLGIEALPPNLAAFDSVFSMGVLYHRRSPLDHLLELKDCLKPGGELILETLVIPGDVNQCLLPEDRYAAMGNVWFLPSVAMLELWLRRCGFTNIRCVDLNQTSLDEQRATEWMHFQSLADFLDPANPNLTREGYPAPLRALVLANRPK